KSSSSASENITNASVPISTTARGDERRANKVPGPRRGGRARSRVGSGLVVSPATSSCFPAGATACEGVYGAGDSIFRVAGPGHGVAASPRFRGPQRHRCQARSELAGEAQVGSLGSRPSACINRRSVVTSFEAVVALFLTADVRTALLSTLARRT